MKEIFIDISKHASRRLERMICRLEPRLIKPVLIRSMAGKDGRDVEDDGGLFVGERVLGSGFVGKSIEPTLISQAQPRLVLPRSTDYHVKDILM
jgi:hypothetical protein